MSGYVCIICRDPLTDKDPQDYDEDMYAEDYHPTVLYCGHIFHRYCIYGWILRQKVKKCPICQAEVLLEDIVKVQFLSDNQKFEDYNSLVKNASQEKLDEEIIAFGAKLKKCYNYLNAADKIVGEKYEVLRDKDNRIEDLKKEQHSLDLVTSQQENERKMLELDVEMWRDKKKNYERQLTEKAWVTENFHDGLGAIGTVVWKKRNF